MKPAPCWWMVKVHRARVTVSRLFVQRSEGKRPRPVTADGVMALHAQEDVPSALVRDHDVIYVYHNRIDATGDKRETEEQVFEAVDKTLQELIRSIIRNSPAPMPTTCW